jgi:hypothetical protein
MRSKRFEALAKRPVNQDGFVKEWIEEIGQFDRIHRHHFFGAIQVDTVAGDKVVDQVKIAIEKI